jgi:hypothetical protein
MMIELAIYQKNGIMGLSVKLLTLSIRSCMVMDLSLMALT